MCNNEVARLTDMLINGLPRRDIDCRDRGLQYGDGFFTTIRICEGQPQLWSRHYARIQHSAQRLAFELPSASKLLAEIRQVSRGHRECVVRLTFTRGVGGRGYQPPSPAHYLRIVARSAMPEHYTTWREQGISLGLAAEQLGHQPMLQGLKSINRLEQVLLKQALQQTHYDDLLVCDDQGKLCETTAANIFWRQGDNWYTPGLERAGIPGVVREEIMSTHTVVECEADTSVLEHIEQAFVCNALLGLVPVKAIADRPLAVCKPFTQQLTTNLHEEVE